MANFTIRKVKTMEEIHGIVEIQRRAWDLVDLEIVPTFEMKAVADVGIVLAAFDQNEKPIGFIYGFHQFPDVHYSHMMAVLPEWQSRGIGLELKKAHREIALDSVHRVNYIKWTVDPLLPNNAYLNFAKLGAYSSKYYVNYYGDPSGFGLYEGLPTDRFVITWPIRSQKVERRIKDYRIDRVSEQELIARSPPINEIQDDRWKKVREFHTLESFTVRVPSNFREIKNRGDVAMEWRLKFRELCLSVFAKGWKAIDYHSFKTNENRVNYYEFSKTLNE